MVDEVQTGHGDAFWGFELRASMPDVVTLPIGNGHPLGAVVTAEVAASFVTGMEYFNTFGGNPVSAEIPRRTRRAGGRAAAGPRARARDTLLAGMRRSAAR